MNMQIKQTNNLAIVSLVSGLLGWTLLPWIGSIVAIVTGHMARAEIRRRSGAARDAAMTLRLPRPRRKTFPPRAGG